MRRREDAQYEMEVKQTTRMPYVSPVVCDLVDSPSENALVDRSDPAHPFRLADVTATPLLHQVAAVTRVYRRLFDRVYSEGGLSKDGIRNSHPLFARVRGVVLVSDESPGTGHQMKLSDSETIFFDALRWWYQLHGVDEAVEV